jgi:hypothetical protein
MKRFLAGERCGDYVLTRPVDQAMAVEGNVKGRDP